MGFRVAYLFERSSEALSILSALGGSSAAPTPLLASGGVGSFAIWQKEHPQTINKKHSELYPECFSILLTKNLTLLGGLLLRSGLLYRFLYRFLYGFLLRSGFLFCWHENHHPFFMFASTNY